MLIQNPSLHKVRTSKNRARNIIARIICPILIGKEFHQEKNSIRMIIIFFIYSINHIYDYNSFSSFRLATCN